MTLIEGLHYSPPCDGAFCFVDLFRFGSCFERLTGQLKGKIFMANTRSARKAMRKIAAHTKINKARRSRVRTFIRKFDDALSGEDKASAEAAFKNLEPEIMRAVSKGVFHKNTAARKISRLSKRLKAFNV